MKRVLRVVLHVAIDEGQAYGGLVGHADLPRHAHGQRVVVGAHGQPGSADLRPGRTRTGDLVGRAVFHL